MHTHDVDEELVAAATEVARTRCRGDNHTMAAAARATPTPFWYTSPAATDAARRMSAAGTVGDPACTLSAVGRPDPALVPRESRIGIGHHGAYWCLLW